MVKIFSVSIIVLVMLGYTCSCRKSVANPSYALPAVTDSGAGTFGCKINGAVWVPYLPCDPDNGPYTEFLCYLRPVYTLPKTAVAMAFSATNNYFAPGGKSTFQIQMERSFNTISSTGNIADSLSIELNQTGGSSFSYVKYIDRGDNHFNVTKFDTVNNIMSGTFNLTLYRSSGNNPAVDSVTITEGRFDLKMYKYYSKTCSD